MSCHLRLHGMHRAGERLRKRSRGRSHSGILDAIDIWYPGMGEPRPILVDAGAIVAYGKTDVGDPSSALHDRTHIGITSMEGYHTVDPGN